MKSFNLLLLSLILPYLVCKNMYHLYRWQACISKYFIFQFVPRWGLCHDIAPGSIWTKYFIYNSWYTFHILALPSVLPYSLDRSLQRNGFVPGPATDTKKSITSERHLMGLCWKIQYTCGSTSFRIIVVSLFSKAYTWSIMCIIMYE